MTQSTPRHPGIMLVRPSPHTPTPSNSATFKRWTIMHFRDLLNIPPRPNLSSQGITRTLRYMHADGSLFYTIHSDDVGIWGTDAYYAVSRRLDLEATREVGAGEEKVVKEGEGIGKEPMVWDLVNAEFGIFELEGEKEEERGDSYHEFPESFVAGKGEVPTAPDCVLVSLTVNFPAKSGVVSDQCQHVQELARHVVAELSNDDFVAMKVYSSLYHHLPDAQPAMHPIVANGEDGDGEWVVCVFVEGDVEGDGLGEVVRRVEREVGERGGDMDVKVRLWRGEVFMG